MGKAYLRYIAVFLAVYLVALWTEVFLHTGQAAGPIELVAEWAVFLGGPVWLISATTATPMVLIALAMTARRVESRPAFIARVVVIGILAGLVSLELWCLAVQDSWAFVATVAVAPVSAFAALSAAALSVRRITHKPSILKVGAAWGLIAGLAASYRVIIPAIAPAFAYRYFDDTVGMPIARRVLLGTRVGDSAAVLARHLPGFIPDDAVEGAPFTRVGLLGTINYRVVIRRGVVDTIDVTPADSE